ncbi:MAG: hypothetical protein U0K48_05105 [Bacilli bacterium]|nr:hypothetical protein [Bacilli bacterium]
MEYSNMSCLEIVNVLKYKSDKEKTAILNTPVIKDKLKKELLKEAAMGNAYYNFRNIINVLSLNYIFDNFDYDDIHEAFKKLSYKDFSNYNSIDDNISFEINNSEIRNSNEYKFFVVLCENDINNTILWILQNDNLFKEFFMKVDNFYSMFCDLDYDLIVKIIYKLDEYRDYFHDKGYDFLSLINKDNQKALLGENFSDDIILKLIGYFNIDTLSYFFLNDRRSIDLFEKIPNINGYINSGVKFNDSILSSQRFFNRLKSSSFVIFRKNINTVETYNNPIMIEQKLKKYYDELISSYDSEEDMFGEYWDVLNNPSLLYNYYDKDTFIFSYDIVLLFEKYLSCDDNDNLYFKDRNALIQMLKMETSKKISEVVIDALFSDNIYNVGINIREMIRYNNKLDKNDKALDDDRVAFYKMILGFDNISSKDKIKLFNEFKDRNFSLTFYDDLRKLKDASYDMIKNDLLDFSKYSDKVSSIDCERTQCLVYDLRDSKYTMLVRSKFPHKDKSNKRRNCYSIISDENNNTFDQGEDNDKIIYGYNSFDNDMVIHMLEQDAFSSDAYNDNKDVSNYVNRIVSKDELVLGSDCYSEVELVNIQDENGKYINQKPDFIVVYDNIRDIDITESKRLNIPIVIIRKNILDKNERIDMEFDREKDRYVNSSSDEVVSRKFR